jgi:hypothetical protein
MRHVLAVLISTGWCALCLELVGPLDLGCQGPTGGSAGPRPQASAPTPPPTPAVPAGPRIEFRQIPLLLPGGPEDSHLLRGRPPAGVLS